MWTASIALPYIIFIGVLLASIIGFYLFVRYFYDVHETEKLPVVVTVTSLTALMICLLVIPIDIFNISHGTDESSNQGPVRSLYYASYIIVLVFGFLVVPFAYFYYEEDDEDITNNDRVKGALKYTTFTIVAALVVVILGLTLTTGQSDLKNPSPWIKSMLDTQNHGDRVIQFILGCIALVGLFGWLTYTSYGLAALPITMIRGRQNIGAAIADIGNSQSVVKEQIRALTSKYQLTGRAMTRKDKKDMERLKRQERYLASRSQRIEDSRSGCLAKTAECLRPFSFLFGISVLLLVLFVVVSLLISSIDRLMHSSCRTACGYALNGGSQVLNPLDKAMVFLASIFPLDYVALILLSVLFFAGTLSGISKMGIRLFCVKLYKLRKGGSAPQALLSSAIIIMFTIVVFSVQVLSILPQYATFGAQTFTVTENGVSQEKSCTLEASADLQTASSCQMSQLATIVNSLSTQITFFSIVFYAASWAFIGTFALGALVASLKKLPSPDGADDDSDFEEDDETVPLSASERRAARV